MPQKVVLTHIDKRGVASVTLNRPDVNNAYNDEMIKELLRVIERLSVDDKVRLIKLQGNGAHFQAGADLNWLAKSAAQSEKENIEISKRTTNLVRFLNECPKPTVAIVHGACVGGGTGLIAACDIVIASRSAFFSISEVCWGLHAGPILPHLALVIGVNNIRRFALTGERIDADEGKRIGLVHEVCEHGRHEKLANRIIEKILKNAPNAIEDTKRIILETSGMLVDDALANKLSHDHGLKRRTKEAIEGLQSFVEKRAAVWD